MGKGNNNRHSGRNTALSEALARADQGGNLAATVTHHPDFPVQVTDPAEVQKHCLEILEGTPGVHEIFQAKLQVEPHPHAGFPVVRYIGGLPECVVRDEIRPGYFIPVTKLLPNPERMRYNSEMEEIFVAFLLSQDEMKLAKSHFFRMQNEKAEAEEAKKVADAEEARQEKLAKIKGAAVSKPQPLTLNRLADILTATYATYLHESGATLVVCRGFNDCTVVRVKSTPEDHPLHNQEVSNIFILQKHLLQDETDTPVAGNGLLAREMREWLRARLREEGALPAHEEATLPANTASDEGVYLGKVMGSEASATS